MPSETALVVLLLAAVAGVLEGMAPQPRGSLLFPAFALAFAAFLLEGHPAATLVCAVGVAAGRAWAGRRRILPDGLSALAGIQAAALAYAVAGGLPHPLDGSSWVALSLFSPAFFLTVLVLRSGWSLATAKKVVLPLALLGLDLVGHLVLTAYGLLIALSYSLQGAFGGLLALVSLLAVTYLFRLQNRLRTRNSELAVLHEMASRLACSLRLATVFDAFILAAEELLRPGVVLLFLVQEPAEGLRLAAARGLPADMPAENGWVEAVRRLAEEGEKLLVPDLARHVVGHDHPPYRAFVIAPLHCEGALIGAVAAGRPDASGFQHADLNTLALLAEPLARAVRNALLYEETESQAITDPITGLYNYRYFRARLHEELRKARLQGSRVALLYLDLDRFKEYNDSLGHQAGDEILVQFAGLLRQSVRQTDIPARYGGDEFVVILPSTAKEEAADVARRLQAALGGRSFSVSGTAVRARLSFSYGISCFPDDAQDEDELIYAADRAMYRHKKAEEGRG